MSATSDLTMIRATKQARKRIDRLGAKLGGRARGWSRPAVIDEALNALETKLAAEAAKPAQNSTFEN